MEKSCKSERLHEKKVNPFARPNSARACSDCLALTELIRLVFIWRKVGPARRVTLPSKKGDPVRRSPFQPSQLFVSHVNGSPSFVRKCRKSWLAKGKSGRRVTLLPGTTFLHINGA